MTDEPERDAPSGEKLERRKQWEIRRARGQRSEDQRPQDYAPIVFPECPGLCHAALVIAGRMADVEADLFDAIVATDEILQALGVIEIMRNGGDGRHAKVQRGPVFKDDEMDLRPLGYGDEDLGRPIAKVIPLKRRTERTRRV